MMTTQNSIPKHTLLGTVLCFLLFTLSLISCKKENQPPETFSVSTAVNLTETTISWTAAVDPEGEPVTYQLILNGKVELENSSQTSYKVSGLEFNQNYQGTVVASDPEGFMTSVDFNFSTGDVPNDAPLDFLLKAPENASQFQDTFLTLSWESAVDPNGDQVSYDIYLDKNSNPNTLLAQDLSALTYQIEGLEDETPYYWKVVAKDNKGAETASNTFSFETRAQVKANLIGTAAWGGRADHQAVVFKGKMWVLGGVGCCGAFYGDVWSSSDGINWQEEVSNAPWGPRGGFNAAVHQGKIWIVGGRANYSKGNEYGDVWSSEDGINWVLEADSTPFAAHYGAEMVAYDNKLWLMGGRDQDVDFFTSIWTSSDGRNWTLFTDSNSFAFSSLGELFIHNDEMWYVGGYNDNASSSMDGLNWTRHTNSAPFGDRLQHSCVSHDGLLWLISGSDNSINQLTEFPDVWYSPDGVNWVVAARNAGFDPVAGASTLSFDGKLWLLGGGGGFQSNFITSNVYIIE
ncbi:MAG: fibronectin type III domain-containing protein [Bacteroidia bacterium]|nr:fibronectin type III domain-containing protein [Bacteroidia bacterium]